MRTVRAALPQPVPSTHVVRTRAQAARLGPALEELQAAAGCPVTARWPWQRCWLDSYPAYEPWIITVPGPDGTIAAAAPLARRRRLGFTEVVALGHGPSDQVRLPARDAAAAALLGAAVLRELGQLGRPWGLRLDQLPADDPAVVHIVRELAHARLVEGDSSPTTCFVHGRILRPYVSRNHHSHSKGFRKRLQRDSVASDLQHLRDVGDIDRVLGEVEDVCRARDADLHRPSQLDDPLAGRFFRQVILDHARRGETVLTTLRFDGELAAYCLCFVDGQAHRMWHTRFAPHLRRYAPGRLVLEDALVHALSAGDVDEFDWMMGEESYKASFATATVPARNLLAGSSAPAMALTSAPHRLRAQLKPLMARDARVQRLVYQVKALADSAGRLPTLK